MDKKKSTELAIETILTRGVEEIIDKERLAERLKRGRPLRVKLGIDPTSPNIHLGRSIPLLKLKDFQDLGHQVVLIIGNFTGLIGDTSDKDSERPMLTEEQVKRNLQSYVAQAAKIIDINRAEIHYNGDWLEELKYLDIGFQANQFSLNEFISRDNIKRRLEAGKRVSLRELLYPLMQGYDSVKVKADVELGGSDQRFNLLAGRDLQRAYGQEPQDIITGPLIEGLDGRKMSSSYGNTVNLTDTPEEMYGKIMSLQDELIIKYFRLTTRVDLATIKGYEQDLAQGLNPRELKMKLAFELTKTYHSAPQAEAAQAYFIKTISNKEIPDELEEFTPSDYKLIEVLVEAGLANSKSEARRLLSQGGVKVNNEVVADLDFQMTSGDVLQKGKLKFLKIS